MKTFKRYLTSVLVAALCLGVISGCGSNSDTTSESESQSSSDVASESESEEETEYETLIWPTYGLATLIPIPESENGEIWYDASDYFGADVYKTSSSDFKAYVSRCQEMGFMVDYYSDDDYYYAYNESGIALDIDYSEDDSEMSITLNVPDEETEPESEPESEEESKPVSEASEDLVDGMRPEIKEAIDSYVDFFESYCEFMESYDSSDLGMLTEYLEFLAQYSETMDKMSAMEDEDLNDAELAYYIDATAEIEKMLLDVAD